MKYMVLIGASFLTNYTVHMTVKGKEECFAQVRGQCINPYLFREREEAERVAKALGGFIAEAKE